MAHSVQKVVQRCELAEENGGSLDLSNCQLVQVPDAVYYLMRNTPLVACDLSSNVISKIPAKLPAKFSFIKSLDISHNRMSALPEELCELTQLEKLDISHNSFVSLPKCMFGLQKVNEINAKKNFIAEVDIEMVSSSPKLETLNLEENPLTRGCESELSKLAPRISVKFTVRGLEDWEDLTI